MNCSEKYTQQLLDERVICKRNDICGDGKPSVLFRFLIKRFGYLLSEFDTNRYTEKHIKRHSLINKILRKVGPLFLKSRQIFENDNRKQAQPTIYISNHWFHDDILATLTATTQHAYIMFGSLPVFYNTLDGLLLYLNGSVVVNRKIKESRKASVEKAKRVLLSGCSMIIFPEGVWNKSPNSLSLPLWSGVYRIAKETGVMITPVIHYIYDPTYRMRRKDNPIHTIVLEPIDVSDMDEVAVLQKIRDVFSTYTYLLMEKYGKEKREDAIGKDNSFNQEWSAQLRKRVSTASYYDYEIETSADFIPRNIVTPYDVYLPVAKLPLTKQNCDLVLSARKIVDKYLENDYQHRF